MPDGSRTAQHTAVPQPLAPVPAFAPVPTAPLSPGSGSAGPIVVAAVAAATFLLSSLLLIGLLQTPAGTIVEPWIDTGNRDAVLVAHDTEYAHDTPDMAWSGSYETCEAGDSSDELRQATLRRVNFYRAMAGVPVGVIENEEFSRKAQHGALTMSAEGELSHTPHDDFACLTGDGAEAAANSNLYLGRTGPRAIDGYIEDPGERNRDVGHRNTILHPPTREMGVGHVAGTEGSHPANALWVFDDDVFAPNPAVREPEGFVAWPPRGFVPPDLIYPRWSFGLAGADFDTAEVSMTIDGDPVEFEVVARLSQQGYVPAPIIVWEPVGVLAGEDGSGGMIDPALDTTFDIVVDNVIVDGAARRFEYSVTVLGAKAVEPVDPAGPTGERPDGLVSRVVATAVDGVRQLAS